MRYIAIILGLYILTINNLSSQNVMLSKFYLHNYSIINPSCINLYEATLIGLYTHHQWFGIKNYPYTQGLFLNSSQNETGWGVGILNNRWGTMGNLSLNLSYSYIAKLNNDWNISSGLSANINQFSLNQSNYYPTEKNDPALSYSTEKTILPNFNAGVTLHNSFGHIGVSLLNVLKNKYKLTLNDDDLNKMVRFYAIHGAYMFSINEQFQIMPSVLFMNNYYNKLYFDATTAFIYGEKYSIALSLSSVKELSILAGIKYQQFQFNYAFGFNMFLSNYIKSYFHEVSIIYQFKTEKPKKLL